MSNGAELQDRCGSPTTDVVLVTGGASGLGAATVEGVLAAGARAVIIDLPAAVAELASAGAGDRARRRRPRRGAGAGRRSTRLGSAGVLRVVVNCAGVATPGRIFGKRGTLPLATLPAGDRGQPDRHLQRAPARRRAG